MKRSPKFPLLCKVLSNRCPQTMFGAKLTFCSGDSLDDQADEYLTTDRGGRGRALTPDQRKAILAVYRWYHAAVLKNGFVEPAEFVRMAYRQRLKGEPTLANYSAVIVDEVQDISEIGLRLLHSVVGDRPDGLLLVGDATQRIFTRGYSLKDFGIDIAGRGLVLRKNYRNTRQILQAAFPLVENEWRERTSHRLKFLLPMPVPNSACAKAADRLSFSA